MAMYHFSLKKDTKPDGTKVKPVDHADYINREGRFKNSDRLPDNLIRSLNGTTQICAGKNIPIYKSPFGNINIAPNGILVSGNASLTTIQIALQVANEVYNGHLTVEGSDRFRDRVVSAAAESPAPIDFASKSLEKLYFKKKELYRNERERNDRLVRRYQPRDGEETGGRGIFPPYRHSGVSESDSNFGGSGIISLSSLNAISPPSLCELPKLGVASNESEEPAMLLQDVPHDQLGNRNGHDESIATVRRIISRSERARLGETTAREILNNLKEHRHTILAQSHVEYINREAAFKKKGGCVYTSHRLPRWADDSAKKFFTAADRYEAKDSTRYREIQFALPNELSLDQNVELIEKFIAANLPNQYYAYAIHDKIGAMSDGSRNVHVHIMFSERIIDDAEKEQERTANKFFAYPKRNAVINEEKRNGGAPKERFFHSKDFLIEARKSCAEITNQMLRKYDKPDRVDYRSLKAMKHEAELQGDEYMVQLLSRMPEKYIGLAATLDFETNTQASALKRFRENRYEFSTKIFEMEMLEEEKNELALQDRFLAAVSAIDEIFQSVEYSELDNLEDDDYLNELKQEVLIAKNDAEMYISAVKWINDLKEEAALKFLDLDEKVIWQKYRRKEEELKKWELFSDSLDKETIQNNLELYTHLEEKLDNLTAKLRDLRPQFQELYDKLLMPVNRNRMQKYIHKTLKNEQAFKRKIDASISHFEAMLKTFNMALFEETVRDNEQEEFQIDELYSIMRKRYYGLKNTFEKAKANRDNLQKKVIGSGRARIIAENIFTKGKTKQLRELKRKMNRTPSAATEKEIGKLEKDISNFMSDPRAEEKIQSIMLGVFEKNKPAVREYEMAKKYADKIFTDLKLAKNDFYVVKQQFEKEKPSTRYKVNGKYSHSIPCSNLYPGGSFSRGARCNNPAIIAEALKGAAAPGNAVLRMNDKGDKMGTSITDWNLMNVYDKEELINKRMMRYV